MHTGQGLARPPLARRSPCNGPGLDELVVGVDLEGVRSTVISEEYSFSSKRAHVAGGLAARALAWIAIEYTFTKPQYDLPEGSTACSRPWSEAVGASHSGVQQQTHVLQHPVHDGMSDGDELLESGLEAKFDCAEQSSDQPYADLCAAVRLRVVGSGVLLGQLLQVFALYSSRTENLLDECLDRWFAVGLDDDFGVAQPFNVLDDMADHEAVLVRALAGDDVGCHHLRRAASDYDAFDDVAFAPRVLERLLASFALWHAELVLLHDSTAGDEEVVQPDNGDGGPRGLSVLKATSPAQVTPLAPRPVRQVPARAVLFDLPDSRTARITGGLQGLDLGLELLLDLDLLGAVLVVEVCHSSSRLPFNPGRSGRQATTFTGSYGYRAEGRLHAA